MHLLGHLNLVGGRDRGSSAVAAAGPGGGQPGASEGVDLELWLLVGGGDASITEQMSHGRSVAEPCEGLVVRR